MIDNTIQVYSFESANIWDDGYPSGGNYWSDYDGSDLFSGQYQNLIRSDGMGDTPYIIDVNNIDRYPLANPWTRFDIAIVGVVPSATEVYIGRTVDITISVQNQGDLSETFQVTCKYELQGIEHVIGVITVDNLPPNTTTTLTFTWITTDVTVHKIKAEIPPLTDETDTADNSMTSPVTVKVKMLGDVNGDDYVGIDDIIVAGEHSGESSDRPRWNLDCDMNLDNYIGIDDIVLIASNFGNTCS